MNRSPEQPRRFRIPALLAAGATLLPTPMLCAQAPYLMKNVNTSVGTAVDGVTSELVPCGGFVYFNADNGTMGKELWRSDGTAGGTEIVVDLTSPGGSDPWDLTCVAGSLFFSAVTGESPHRGVWKTDGTAGGTELMSAVNMSSYSYVENLTAAGSRLFFAADDGIHGRELWMSDGTPAGTNMVADICYGACGSMAAGAKMIALGNTVLLSATDGFMGDELWRSDGTTGGTRQVRDINLGTDGSSPGGFSVVNNQVLFYATEPEHGWELWRTDGTESGTALLRDIRVGAEGSYPGYLTPVADTLYFIADNGVTGPELWKSDGTESGTALVKDILPDGAYSYPVPLGAVGSTLYFRAEDATNGAGLWTTTGSEESTVLVKVVEPSDFPGGAALDGVFYFSANDSSHVHGLELWRSDGTTDGTWMVEDISANGDSSPQQLTVLGSRVLFHAADDQHGRELWATDPSSSVTTMLRNVASEEGSSDPDWFTRLGDSVVFDAEKGYDRALWRTDGSSLGTQPVRSIFTYPSMSDAGPVFSLGDSVLFAGRVSNGMELWFSDGTSAGTTMVEDIYPGFSSSSPSGFVQVGPHTLFQANDGEHGVELWSTDGSAAGTGILLDINPATTQYSHIRTLGILDGELLFSATSATEGKELWKTDGTSAGTVLVKDINPSGDSLPSYGLILGSEMYFAANDGGNGSELWKTDGTSAGTALVKDIRQGSTGSAPSSIAAYDGRVFYSAGDGTHGYELWSSDGTAEGTRLVKDIAEGPGSSYPSYIATVGGRLVLSADDGVHGREVWVSDGTTSGTHLLADLVPGSAGSGYVRVFGSTANYGYFATYTREHGSEVWRTDGTEAGTALAGDVWEGPGSSYPEDGRIIGSRLYFSAVGGPEGREPWALCVGEFYADADGDGRGDPASVTFACEQPAGTVDNRDDCADGDDTVFTGAPELCDGKDNNCIGQVDEPTFAGVTSALPIGGPECGVRVDWNDATVCTVQPVYNVYRSTESGFIPGPDNVVATCMTDTTFIDTSVAAGTTYHYVVRAEDGLTAGDGPCFSGAEEKNTVSMQATPDACTGGAGGAAFLSSRSRDLEVRLDWLNPSSTALASQACWRVDGYPSHPWDGTCITTNGDSGFHVQFAHESWVSGGIANNTTYYYGVWVLVDADGVGGQTWSAGRFITGRPFDSTGPVKWAYATRATALGPVGIRPGVTYFSASNDRNLHGMKAGPDGGAWPPGWVPGAMNGPSQSRPVVIPFGTPTVGGADTVVLTGSQDGRVHAFDAASGAELWQSPVLGDAVQASPGGMFTVFGGAYDLILVGSRTAAGDSKFYGLHPSDGSIAWTFDNGGGANGIGIISAQAWVDYANDRVYFTSRAKADGSSDTVWCLQFTETGAERVWSASLGDIDSAPNLRHGVLYLGTNAGLVYALDASTGSELWATPYTTGDGPVKGTVWVDVTGGVTTLYFATTGSVHALRDDGTSATSLWSPVALDSPSPVLVMGDNLYLGCADDNGTLQRLDRWTGLELGSVVLGDPTVAKTIGIPGYDTALGELIVGAEDGAVYAVDGGF